MIMALWLIIGGQRTHAHRLSGNTDVVFDCNRYTCQRQPLPIRSGIYRLRFRVRLFSSNNREGVKVTIALLDSLQGRCYLIDGSALTRSNTGGNIGGGC
jgi:hypothetical protein